MSTAASLQLWAERPGAPRADAAVLGEPTGRPGRGRLPGDHAGPIRLAGARAHTGPPPGRVATPSTASAPLLDAVAEWRVRRPVLDGCEYAEQLQAVAVEGGRGRQRRAGRGRPSC